MRYLTIQIPESFYVIFLSSNDTFYRKELFKFSNIFS